MQEILVQREFHLAPFEVFTMKNGIIWFLAGLALVIGVFFVIKYRKPAPPPVLDQEKGLLIKGKEFQIEINRKQPNSYKEALEMAEVTKQKILVVFSASWCDPCKKLKSEVLSSPEIKELLKNYLIIYIDIEAERELSRRFGVEALPSYFVVHKKEITKQGEGFRNVAEFKTWLGPNP